MSVFVTFALSVLILKNSYNMYKMVCGLILAIFGFAWVGIEIGKFVGGQMQSEAWGHIIALGFIFLVGTLYYAYSQAKIDIKYNK